MISIILAALGLMFLLVVVGMFVVQSYKLRTGKLVVPEDYNGPQQVSVTLHTIIRLLLKQSIYVRKFLVQYVFHVMVRFMYHFDILTTKLYARSRNWFVQNAVRNKGTVSHFWEHLKVYKQEMDKEKEEQEFNGK